MTKIVFADEKIKKAFENLKASKTESKLYENLKKAFDEIEKNPSGFIHIKRHLIPKEYMKKYGINNLWKYNLPDGWRLLYSLGNDEIEIITLFLNGWITRIMKGDSNISLGIFLYLAPEPKSCLNKSASVFE